MVEELLCMVFEANQLQLFEHFIVKWGKEKHLHDIREKARW